MNSYYDITNPDISFDWLHEVLHMKQGGLIDEYCLECHNDFDRFYEKFLPEINEIDIESLEIVAFQVTSNDNGCADIKKHGLRNLQWVLSNETSLSRFLKQRGISFDIGKKLMHILGKEYDVDYEKYKDLDCITRRNGCLHKIGHKLFYDFQINAFLFCKDIYDYATVHEAPEFLLTLSSLNDQTREIDTAWKKMSTPYVIKFKANLKDFAYFTFYDREEEYYTDQQNHWYKLRRKLVSRAVESAFSESASEIFAYMKPTTFISPDNILAYIPAEEWRKDVLKYFREE